MYVMDFDGDRIRHLTKIWNDESAYSNWAGRNERRVPGCAITRRLPAGCQRDGVQLAARPSRGESARRNLFLVPRSAASGEGADGVAVCCTECGLEADERWTVAETLDVVERRARRTDAVLSLLRRPCVRASNRATGRSSHRLADRSLVQLPRPLAEFDPGLCDVLLGLRLSLAHGCPISYERRADEISLRSPGVRRCTMRRTTLRANTQVSRSTKTIPPTASDQSDVAKICSGALIGGGESDADGAEPPPRPH